MFSQAHHRRPDSRSASRRTARGRATRRRSGVETIEMIVGVPVLFVLFVAIVQYGVQMLVQLAITQAAAVGAREAGKGADLTEVVAAVDTVLAAHNVVISNAPGSLTAVMLEDGLGPTTSTFGDPGLSCTPPAPVLAADEVRVTLCVGLTKSPLLNALPSFGFDTTGMTFEISALVQKE